MIGPKPHHHLQPADVGAVVTRAYEVTVRWLDDIVEPGNINCYTGPAGSGKTFTVTWALAERDDTVRYVKIDCPVSPTKRSLLTELASALDMEFTPKASAHDVSILLWDELKPNDNDDRVLCVVVDECQRMKSTECAELLRSLVENAETQFSLLLIGGDGARAVLEGEPMLWSRMYCPARILPMECEEVLEMLPNYCPSLYESANPELLEWIYREHCHGSFRSWAGFTGRAQRIMKRNGLKKLTTEVAESVFAEA